MAYNFVPIVDEVYEAFRREFDDKIRAIEGNLDIENETKIDVLQKRLEWLERPAFVTAMEKDGRAEVLDYYDHIKQRLIDRIRVLTKDEETFKERKAAYLQALDGIKAKIDDLNVSEYTEQALNKKYGKTLSLEHIKNGTEITTIGLDINTSLNETTPGQKQDLASKQEKLSEIFKAINKANEECLLNRVWLADPQFKATKTAMDSYKSQIEIYKAHVKKMADIVNDIIDKVKAVDVDIETYKTNITKFKDAAKAALMNDYMIDRDTDDDGVRIPFGKAIDAISNSVVDVLNYEYNSIINKFTLNAANIKAVDDLIGDEGTITNLLKDSNGINKELIDKYNETPTTPMMDQLRTKFNTAIETFNSTNGFADEVAKLEEANVRLGKIRTRFNQRTVLKKYVNDLNDDKKFFKEVLTNAEGRNFEKEIKPLIDEYYNNTNPVRITARTYAGVNKKLNVNTDESSILFSVLAANNMWDNNNYTKMLTVRTVDNSVVIENKSKEDKEVVQLRTDLNDVRKKIKVVCLADFNTDGFEELYKTNKWVKYWEEKKSKLVKSLGGLKRTILTKFINPDLEELNKKDNELNDVLAFRKAKTVLSTLKAPVEFDSEKLTKIPTVAESNNILAGEPFNGKYPIQYHGVDIDAALSMFDKPTADSIREARNQFTDIIGAENTKFSYIAEDNSIVEYPTTPDDAGFKEDDQDIRNIITEYGDQYKKYLDKVSSYRNKAKEQERIYNTALQAYTDTDRDYTNDLNRFITVKFINRKLSDYEDITKLITDINQLIEGNRPRTVRGIEGIDDTIIDYYLAYDTSIDGIKVKNASINTTFERAKMYYDTLIRDRNLVLLAGGNNIPAEIAGSGIDDISRLSVIYRNADDLIKAYTDKKSLSNNVYKYTPIGSYIYGHTYVKAAYDDLGKLITSLNNIAKQLKKAKTVLDNIEEPHFNNHDVLAKNNLNNAPHDKYFNEVYSTLVAKINDYAEESMADTNLDHSTFIKQLKAQYEYLGLLQQDIKSNLKKYTDDLKEAVKGDPTDEANELISRVIRGESINSIDKTKFAELNSKIDNKIAALSVDKLDVNSESSPYHGFVGKDEINYPFSNYNTGRLTSIRAYQELKEKLSKAEIKYNQLIEAALDDQVDTKNRIIAGIKGILDKIDNTYRLPIGEESHDHPNIETYVFSENEKLNTPAMTNNPSKLAAINHVIENITTSINNVKDYLPENPRGIGKSSLALLETVDGSPQMTERLKEPRREVKELISKLIGADGKLNKILKTYIDAKADVETKVSKELKGVNEISKLMGKFREYFENQVDFMTIDGLYKTAEADGTETYKTRLADVKREIDGVIAMFDTNGDLAAYAESSLIKNKLDDLRTKSNGLGNAINYLTNKVVAYDPNDSKIDKFVKCVEGLKNTTGLTGVENKIATLKPSMDLMQNNPSYETLKNALISGQSHEDVDQFLTHIDGEIRQVNEYIKSLEAIISGPNENNPDNIANAVIDTEHGANGAELTDAEKKKFKANKDARDRTLTWITTAIRNATDLKDKLDRLRANVAKPTPTPEGPKPGTETGNGHTGDSAGTTPVTPTEGAGHEETPGTTENPSNEQPQPPVETPLNIKEEFSEEDINQFNEDNDNIVQLAPSKEALRNYSSADKDYYKASDADKYYMAPKNTVITHKIYVITDFTKAEFDEFEAIHANEDIHMVERSSRKEIKKVPNSKYYKASDVEDRYYALPTNVKMKHKRPRYLRDVETSDFTLDQFRDDDVLTAYGNSLTPTLTLEQVKEKVKIVTGEDLLNKLKYVTLFNEEGAINTEKVLRAYDFNNNHEPDEHDKFIVLKGGNA